MKRETFWMVTFFVALFAFELRREILVVEADEPPNISQSKLFYQHGDFVNAEGSWVRSDGGDTLVPNVAKIQCNRAQGTCTETGVQISDLAVFGPDTETFEAKFGEGGISYGKDYACVTYRTHIDPVTESVQSVRLKKQNPANGLCNVPLEERMEMRLADSRDAERDPLEGHFVPLLRLIAAIF